MVLEAIFAHAAHTPGKDALIDDERSLSYRQFADRIDAAAGAYFGGGLTGPGYAIVAIRRLSDFWITALALRRLGLTTMAARSTDDIAGFDLPNLRGVVTTTGETWPSIESACVRVRAPLVAMPADARGAAPRPAGRFGDHILQTSGTTGAYKKVLVEAGFETQLARQRCELDIITADSVVGVLDLGGWTGVGYKTPIAAWTLGAAAVFHQSRPRWRALLQKGLTHCHAVPQMLADILADPDGAFPHRESLRLIVSGGAMSQGLSEAARARITPHLFNNLGTTETGTYGYTAIESPEDRRWHRLAPGVGVEVVDEADQPLPAGHEGRVRISTEAGPDNYLGDPEASAAFFRCGAFYPGDLAVLGEDGRLALRGRATDVLNIMGSKVAPGPMEDAMREQLGVSEVVMFSLPNEAGEEQLYLVIESSRPLDPADVSQSLSRTVPGFPNAQAYFVSKMPRNAMGKVMRRDLRQQVLGLRRS